MGAVASAVSNAVSDVVEAAGSVVSNVGQAVEQVGQTVGNVAQAVANDPLPVLISIAATPVLGPAAAAIGLPSAAVAPLTAAAISAAQGNSIEEIALSAASSYVGGQVAGQVAGALPPDVSQVVSNIVPSAAQGAAQAAITGQDPLLAALGSGVAGGVAGQVAPQLGQTAGNIAGQAAGTAAVGGNVGQAVGSGLVSAGLGQVSGALGNVFGNGQAQTPTDVAQAEQPEGQSMDEILAEMIGQELNAPSTPSPFAPIAAGGVASDFAPTPLVPTPIGTVTVTSPPVDIQGEGIAFEDLPPIEDEFVAEAPMPSPVAPQPTLPISQQDQQIFNLVQELAAQQPTAPQAPATAPPQAPTPEIVPMPPIAEQAPIDQAPVTEAPTQAPVAEQPAPPMSAGPVEQPSPTAPTMGGGMAPQDQELIDLINAINGTQPETTGGTGQTLAGMETIGGGGTEEGGMTGESMGMEEEEFVDTGPREPGEQLPAEGGGSVITVMGPAEAPVRPRRAGFAPSDSALSALLGTSLSEAGASKPIMGEDESQRRAVWNLESLRNALGI
jgi:hypothetical protein